MTEFTTVSCPECSVKLKLKLAGKDLTEKRVKCPGCEARFSIEDAIENQPSTVNSDDELFDNRRRQARRRAAATKRATAAAADSDYDPEEPDEFESPRSANAGGQGFFGWLMFGSAAGLCCAAATALAAYAENSMIIAGFAVVTGIAVGAAIRIVGRSECGAGSAIVAAFIAIGCMLAGKVGAFIVAPQLSEISSFADEIEIMSLEETRAEIEELSSEDGMIETLAGELESNEDWLSENEITDDMLSAHWEQMPEGEEVAIESRYLPKIWTEATRRWNENSDDAKQALIAARQKELRADYGMMNEEEVEEAIEKATTDEAMIEAIAWDVQYDDDWLAESNITEDQIDEFDESIKDDATASETFLPAIWEEASRRWEEKPAIEKKRQQEERAEETRLEDTRTEEDQQIEEAAIGIVRFLFVAAAAIAHFFTPVTSFVCTLVGLLAAVALASGFPSLN